jgi:hypothetical protein
MVDVLTVVEVGAGHYEIQVAEFGTIHLVPPAMAATLYRELNLGQRVSAIDPAVEAIEGVLAEIQESAVAVSAILQRSSGRRRDGGSGEPITSATPQVEHRATTRPSASLDMEAAGTKRQR